MSALTDECKICRRKVRFLTKVFSKYFTGHYSDKDQVSLLTVIHALDVKM